MPQDLKDLLLLAMANPAAIAAGYLIGRNANQVQKIVLAAFVAGVAGALFALVLMRTGLAEPQPRLLGGIFVVSGLVGMIFAGIGYWSRGLRR